MSDVVVEIHYQGNPALSLIRYFCSTCCRLTHINTLQSPGFFDRTITRALTLSAHTTEIL